MIISGRDRFAQGPRHNPTLGVPTLSRGHCWHLAPASAFRMASDESARVLRTIGPRRALAQRAPSRRAPANRAEHFALGVAPDDREGHLDVQLASAPVQRTGERRTALEPRGAPRHRGVEAAPVRRSQVLGDDQFDALVERLLGGMAEQRGGGTVPASDRSRAVGADDGVGELIENHLGQLGLLFHNLNSPVRFASFEHRSDRGRGSTAQKEFELPPPMGSPTADEDNLSRR
jgi:hypothetical protein